MFKRRHGRFLPYLQKLSKYKFQTEPMEVQLTEELAGSLRQLKPEGSLVKDRFKYVLWLIPHLPLV